MSLTFIAIAAQSYKVLKNPIIDYIALPTRFFTTFLINLIKERLYRKIVALFKSLSMLDLLHQFILSSRYCVR